MSGWGSVEVREVEGVSSGGDGKVEVGLLAAGEDGGVMGDVAVVKVAIASEVSCRVVVGAEGN